MVPLSVLQVPRIEQVLSTHSQVGADPLNHCRSARKRCSGAYGNGRVHLLSDYKDAKATEVLCPLPWLCVMTCSRVLGSQQEQDSATLILQPISCAKGARPAPFPTLPGELRLRDLWLPPRGLENLSSQSGGLIERDRRGS